MHHQSDLSHVRPNHVNEEALVFRGCTSSEISFITTVVVAFWTVMTIVVGLIISKVWILFGFSLLLSLLTVFALSTLLQHVKRGRPPGHYQQRIALVLGRNRLKRSPYVLHDGEFAIGRSKQVILTNRHLGRRLAEQEVTRS